MMPFSESDDHQRANSSRMVVMQALAGVMEPLLCFFIHVSWTQADDSSPWPASGCPGDNAVNAGGDRARKSSEERGCEDDEEGHLVYHVGLVMKARCT